MDAEWPVWRVVLDGHPLQEVLAWDLDDIRKYNALKDLKGSFEMAMNEYQLSRTRGSD